MSLPWRGTTIWWDRQTHRSVLNTVMRAVEAPREVSRNHSTLDFHVNLDAYNICPQSSPPPPTLLAQGTHMEGHCPGNVHINPQGPHCQCRHTPSLRVSDNLISRSSWRDRPGSASVCPSDGVSSLSQTRFSAHTLSALHTQQRTGRPLHVVLVG